MLKEKVVVFDGESNFITPKNRIYNKRNGKSEFVGVVESPEGNKSPITTIDGDAFNDYMRKKNLRAVLPSLSEPDFCSKAAKFIQNNGEGRATPDEVMQVYQLFQDNCVEKPKEITPIEKDSPPPVEPEEEQPVFPNWETLDCETLGQEINKIEQVFAASKFSDVVKGKYERAIQQAKSLQDLRCPKVSPAISTLPLPSSSGVSLSVPSLGKPPVRGGAASGGGGEIEKQEPKRKTNWLLLLLIGGAAFYFITRKK